ncbi:hypothetical protein JKG47_19115 [Acidithiobacillus sp. MC6.1]|nr:hypothetical protein [Acidithiobacillus sp. MC6.1]
MGIGWSTHRNGGWRGQFDRATRWHERVRSAAATGSSDLEDFAFAFFQNCYHLREWMLKTSGATQQELDGLFAQNRELQLCRDICNGTKHLSINRPSVDANFSIGREYAPQELSGSRMFVIADAHYDLLGLADRCMELWQQFVERARV